MQNQGNRKLILRRTFRGRGGAGGRLRRGRQWAGEEEMHREWKHRPEIDGLRALAVLGVIVFHLDAGLLPGGFMGVDVFFVISGYLVGGVLLGAEEAGGVRLGEFWQRRVARIWPAFGMMLMAVLGAALVWYDDWDRAATGAAVAAALCAWSNHHQLGLGGYFAVSEDTQPLLHCWSLAVEEQFYLLLPLGFMALRRGGPLVRLRLVVLLAGVSFALCLWMTGRHPAHAFYLLPARAWELLAGVILAMRERIHGPMRSGCALSGLLGLAMILMVFAAGRGSGGFPGWLALVPVMGAAAVIGGNGAGWVGRFLSATPMQAVGRWSYSLYLWHWPVFSFTDYRMLTATEAARTAVKLFLTAGLALACHYGVEAPARTALRKPANRKQAWVLAAALLLAGIPAGLALRSHFYKDGADSADGRLVFPATGATDRGIILVGDSHATMYASAVRSMAEEQGRRFVLVSEAGGDPLAPGLLNDRVNATIATEKPELVILACHWAYKLSAYPERLAVLSQQMLGNAGRLVLLMQPPLPPPEAERSALRHGQRPPFRETSADAAARFHARRFVEACAGPRISIIDPAPLFQNPDGSLRILDTEGHPVFHDRNHLTARATLLVRTLLEIELREKP
jgi:peptidoglycan/LPS O-acetylase OafA/YrhL